MAKTDTQHEDPLAELIAMCVASYAQTYSDTVALNANGVLGKDRVLVLEDPRYKRETRKLKAQHIINDVAEINDLLGSVDDEPTPQSGTEDESEEPKQDEYTEGYDIRDKAKQSGKKKRKNAKDDVPVKPPAPRRFDKTKIELRLKLLQQRRDILDTDREEEDKEASALNIFFVAVSKEEFEALETVEVSEGTGGGKNPYELGEEGQNLSKKAIKEGERLKKEKMKEQGKSHFEMIGGEQMLVEDF